VSRGVDLLEFSEDALQLLGRNPTTSIADNNLDCNVSFSAKSIRFVKYVCCHCDGPLRSILDSICSEVGDGSFDLLASPMTYFGVFPGSTLNSNFAPDRLQPRRELARPSTFVSFTRTDRHKSPHGGCYENRTVRGMPFPCQLPVSSSPTKD
jgi:hypothetical protein